MQIEDGLAYVRTMDRANIAALADFEVQAQARRGRDLTGVWVEDRKIASIGVHIARGVTTHGFAVNVDNDLAPFDWVVPCGLSGVRMTSVQAETGRSAASARRTGAPQASSSSTRPPRERRRRHRRRQYER